MPEPKGIPNNALKALWNIGPPAPIEPDAPPPEPPQKQPPDFGGGPRGKADPRNEPSMDELLRAAARGHVERQ